MSGCEIFTVKELMGHKDIKMTMRYSHLAPEHKKAAVEMISKVVKKAVENLHSGQASVKEENKMVSLKGVTY